MVSVSQPAGERASGARVADAVHGTDAGNGGKCVGALAGASAARGYKPVWHVPAGWQARAGALPVNGRYARAVAGVRLAPKSRPESPPIRPCRVHSWR